MTRYVSGSDGHRANHLSDGPAQEVNSGVASAESTAFGASVQLIRIVNLIACRYIIGNSPQTALATSALLPANTVEFVGVRPGQVIATIQEGASGVLSVVECG